MNDPNRITTDAELREVIPEPSQVIHTKIFDHVDSTPRRSSAARRRSSRRPATEIRSAL